MKRFASCVLLWPLLALRVMGQEAKPLPLSDDRYKADILLVVAHPDDEGAATAYLARAIDEKKRIAVVYGTRGSSGANEAGAEQAAALGAIREMEARHALAALGITNVWFLAGKDTASQNVLQSLANWEHGAALEQMVRLVRLTRPEVILTFLPGTFIGEDHGDHQASGVLATEAFDLAGDAAAFPSQVAAPMRRLEPYLENLQPWQPKKIYYFPDASSDQMFRGKGPEYSVREIAKVSKHPYWRISMDCYLMHQTQSKNFHDVLGTMDEAQIERMATSDGWTDAQRFVLGKSLVGGSVTGDVFENIITGATIPFSLAGVSQEPEQREVSAELAGPWKFYRAFRRIHGLDHLPHPEPPEIALQAGTSLVIPLLIRNPTSGTQEVTLSAETPDRWTLQSGAGKFTVAAQQVAATRFEIGLPGLDNGQANRQEPREVVVRAQSHGQSVGIVRLRVELRKRALPQ